MLSLRVMLSEHRVGKNSWHEPRACLNSYEGDLGYGKEPGLAQSGSRGNACSTPFRGLDPGAKPTLGVKGRGHHDESFSRPGGRPNGCH
jgi:hypothetical protein